MVRRGLREGERKSEGKFDCGVVDWRKGCGIEREGKRERERRERNKSLAVSE